MKSLFTVLLVLWVRNCFAQGFLIFDTNDYINPNWLNREYYGDSSVKRIYYLSVFGGQGSNVVLQSSDSVSLQNFYNQSWLSGSVYYNRFQLSLKSSYLFFGGFSTKKDAYTIKHILNPKVQLAYYPPVFGRKSYLSNQLRLQLTMSPTFDFSVPSDNPNRYSANYQFEYGGFVTNPDRESKFLRTAVLANYNLTPDSKIHDYSYGGSVFTSVWNLNTKDIESSVYLQGTYFRSGFSGVDMANSLKFGLVEELYFEKNSSSSFYFFANYTIDYNSSASLKDPTIGPQHTIHFGIFFNFPLYGHDFYTHYH